MSGQERRIVDRRNSQRKGGDGNRTARPIRDGKIKKIVGRLTAIVLIENKRIIAIFLGKTISQSQRDTVV